MSRRQAFPYRLYLVISEADCKGRALLQVAEQAIQGGADILQLREKGLSPAAFTARAAQLKALTDAYQVPLIINDDLETAIEVNAAGIHVGNNDLPPVAIRGQWTAPGRLVGYSIEDLAQLQTAQVAAASYLGVSPVFRTTTKTDTVTEWGLDGIAAIRALTDKPLVAIGNIHAGNALDVMRSGADCIAVVSAICGAADPRAAAYELKNQLLK